MRVSQSFFCSGVAPTVIGSLPRNVASTDVAMPKSIRAISSQTQYTSNAPPPNPPNSSGMNKSWIPSLSGLHMWRTISSGHSSRSSNSRSVSSGRRFFAKSCSDFRLSFSVFFAIIVDASLSRKTQHDSRIRVVNSGKNSRMSSTIPMSAAWKMGAFGFLLMATRKGFPLMPARC